jgi:hypothetical protein
VRCLPATSLGPVAQPAERPALNREVAGSTPAGAIAEGLPSVRYPVSKTGGAHALGGSTPSPSASSFRCGRAGKTRDCYSRGAGSTPAAGAARLRGRNGDDAGPSTRKLRVRAPPEVLYLPVGESGHPAGFGSRRPLVRIQPGRLRGRGVAVLASLMSSRPWVRIPLALPRTPWGRSSAARALGCRPRRRRFESGRPRQTWPWCSGSILGRDPSGAGSNPAGHFVRAGAEHR